MHMQFVKRIHDQFASLLVPLALAIIVSGCDTGQSLGKYGTDLQAADDSFTLSEDSSVAGNVSTNDSVGSRTYSLGSPPSNGTVDLSSDGSLSAKALK